MVEWKKLGSICKFQNGFAFKSELFKDEGIPVVRITNISDNKVNMDECKYFNLEDYGDLALFKINKGDILIAMSGATTGKIGVYKKQTPAYLNQRVGRFVPQNNILDNRYLYHYLVGKGQDIYIMAGGGAQPNLSSTKLMENLVIAVPILDEQKQISGILDTFTSSIENLKEQIAQRRKQYEYYRDQLLDLEGKEGVEIGAIAKFVKDRIIASELTPQNYTSVENLLKNKAGRQDAENVPTEGNWLRYEKGDILIGNIRPYLRKIWLSDREGGTNGDVVVIRSNDMFLPKYVYYCLASEKFFLYYNQALKDGKMPRGEKKRVLLYVIPLIEKEAQSRIVSILDTFEASISNLEDQLSLREKQYEYYRNKLLTFE